MRKIHLFGFLAVVLALLFSCATVPKEKEVMEILAVVSAGDVPVLMEASRSPFLLDGEILQGEAMRELLWDGLAAAGFSFTNPRILDVRKVTPEMHTLFGSSMDVEVFFKKYLTKKDSLVHLVSDEGEWYLIVGPAKEGRQMAGWGTAR